MGICRVQGIASVVHYRIGEARGKKMMVGLQQLSERQFPFLAVRGDAVPGLMCHFGMGDLMQQGQNELPRVARGIDRDDAEFPCTGDQMVAMLGLPVAYDLDEDGVGRQHRLHGHLPAVGHVRRDSLHAAFQQKRSRTLRLARRWGKNTWAAGRTTMGVLTVFHGYSSRVSS